MEKHKNGTALQRAEELAAVLRHTQKALEDAHAALGGEPVNELPPDREEQDAETLNDWLEMAARRARKLLILAEECRTMIG